MSTHGIDFVAKSFQLSDGSVVNCLIYDTCGQEKYSSINVSYYKKADAALLVYDISTRESFDKIKEFYSPNIKEFCKKKIPIILLGNKADKEDFRKVDAEEGIQLALEENYKFKETSCLKNENVADAFEALIEMWNIENINNKNEGTRKRACSGEKKNVKNELHKTNTGEINTNKNWENIENDENENNKARQLSIEDFNKKKVKKGGCC